jgi:hypothetical protein
MPVCRSAAFRHAGMEFAYQDFPTSISKSSNILLSIVWFMFISSSQFYLNDYVHCVDQRFFQAFVDNCGSKYIILIYLIVPNKSQCKNIQIAVKKRDENGVDEVFVYISLTHAPSACLVLK